MASESYYRGSFCAEIIAAYSKEKFTNARMQAVWSAVKTFHDNALAIALKEITKPAYFPGADKIIEICSRANADLKAIEVAKAKEDGECSFCSNGIRQVNGYAYRCNCKIGELLHPNLSRYDGQPPWSDKQYTDQDGNEVRETQTHIYRRKPGSKNLKDFSFTLKQLVQTKPKSDFSKPKLVKMDQFAMDNF
jgi:hypothetical protein